MSKRNFFPILNLILWVTLSPLAMMKDSDGPQPGTLRPLPENLPKEISPEDITYAIIPPSSGLNYKINIYDIFEPVAGHFHEHQTQCITVLEGKLKVQIDSQAPLILGPTESVKILPHAWHALDPMERPVRYISAYFFDAARHPNGLPFPEDVFTTK